MMDKGVTLLVHIYKSRGDLKNCTNYSNKIMKNNWEKAKTRIKYVESQFGFMHGRPTKDDNDAIHT